MVLNGLFQIELVVLAGTVVISGETGCGKTTLLKYFVQKIVADFSAVVAVPTPTDTASMDSALEEQLANVGLCFR